MVKIGIDDNKIYITWSDTQHVPTPSHLYYRMNLKNSIDNGYSFGNIVNLAAFGNLPPDMSTSRIPLFSQISVSDNSNAYVVWPDNTQGNLEIYFKRIN